MATETLELLEQEPRIDVIFVPVGGGSGAAGACIVAKARRPAVRVIGVQSEAAPAAYRSWKERRPVEDCDGDVRRGPRDPRRRSSSPSRSSGEHLDDFVLVSRRRDPRGSAADDRRTRNLIEAAGAAPLAAALRLRDELDGKRVALVASGGNVSPDQLRELLEPIAAPLSDAEPLCG